MAITITRDLNVVSVGVPPVIHLSQYDSDFTLVFNLYASTGAFTMPTGTTAEIRGTKRDGNGYDAAASVSGSTVTVTGDEQMTAIAGQNMFEIATYYNNKRLNTINFILDVERAALDADTITSESVLRELDAIIQGAATATQAAEDAEDAADRAEEAADDLSGTVQQVATNTQDIAGLKDELDQKTGLSDEAKVALLDCFAHVMWIDEHGQQYYDALEDALYPSASKLQATFVADNRFIFEGDPIDTVRYALLVTYDGEPVEPNNFNISGNVVAGNTPFTVTYNNESTQVIVPIEPVKYSLTYSGGDLSKFNGTGNSYDSHGQIPVPYLKLDNTSRAFYASKGHYPYYDNNIVLQDGKYPIAVPADATSVTIAVTPSNLRVAMNGWKYKHDIKKYSYLMNTDSGYIVGSTTINLPSEEEYARAINVICSRGGSAFTDATEPTQYTVTFNR